MLLQLCHKGHKKYRNTHTKVYAVYAVYAGAGHILGCCKPSSSSFMQRTEACIVPYPRFVAMFEPVIVPNYGHLPFDFAGQRYGALGHNLVIPKQLCTVNIMYDRN